MKNQGLIFDIRRYSVHDGPGIRTTVFMKGCPLNCLWCHNPESILPDPQKINCIQTLDGQKKVVQKVSGQYYTLEEVMLQLRSDRIFFEESGGGVSISGGEPLLQYDFLLQLLRQCRQEGIHTAVDTSGYSAQEVFLEVAAQTDLLLLDIKTTDFLLHKQYTGKDPKPVLNNLKALQNYHTPVIIRIPVIPGFNSRADQMLAIAKVVKESGAKILEVHLLPYHKLGRQKYEALGMPPPPVFEPDISTSRLQELLHIFTEAGFKSKSGG